VVNKLCCTCGQILPIEKFPKKIVGHRREAECETCIKKQPMVRQRPKILGKSSRPPRLAGLHSPVSPPPQPSPVVNVEVLQDGMKKCKQCEQVKPYTKFNKSQDTPDGYRTICRTCSGKRFHESINTKAMEWWENCIKDYSQERGWFTAKQMKTIMQYSLSFSRLVLNRLTELDLLEKKTMNRVKHYRYKSQDSDLILNDKLTALAK